MHFKKINSYLIRFILILWTGLLVSTSILAQETVTLKIDAEATPIVISPYIFGRNNSLSDNESEPLTQADWQFLRDAGIKMFRENGGNNLTKYNWRRKLSSHPDWYNNVFAHNWDYAAASLQQNIPDAQGIWGFQLIGKAALTNAYNFNSWEYNQSQWWSGVHQNLCGGGVVNPDGGEDALVDGDIDLYLEDWNADSTTGILSHWFGADGIGLDSSNIRYWSMDNEPEIWSSTHDDVFSEQPAADSFIQMYVNVALKARQLFPGIKLMGPVPANEWQWYNWDGDKISYNGKNYVWLEYFIMRIAEEEARTGKRLLDVLDIHFYPGESDPADIVQLHRVYFDKTYDYPGANGVKRSGTGGWDNTITKEYIFERCKAWLDKYMGPDNGVTFSVSETGINSNDANVVASWYASTLGEFEKHGVEIFTPWSWKTGMFEVIHLFTHLGKPYFIPGISSDEEYVSVYPNINETRDSVTLFIVNRHLSDSKSVRVAMENFPLKDGTYKAYKLASLPDYETFVSNTTNVLQEMEVQAVNDTISFDLSPLSVTAVLLVKSDNVSVDEHDFNVIPGLYPNPAGNEVTISLPDNLSSPFNIEVIDSYGRVISDTHYNNAGNYEKSVRLNVEDLASGIYWIRLQYGNNRKTQKLFIN